LDLSLVLDKIYSQPKPSSYLASFIPFIHDNIDNPFILSLVESSFEELYDNHLSQIPELNQYGLGIVGSVGYIFRQVILETAKMKGFQIHGIIQYPIDNLVKYHIESDL
jgi:hypothetical protein